jgi:Ca2+/Na+ antiporter
VSLGTSVPELLPIALERATLRYDLPTMAVAALLLYVLSRDGTLTTPDGVVLLLGGVAYTAGLVRVGRREAAESDLAVGNLIGSSIYDVGAVLGLTVVVAAHGAPVPDEVLAADLGLFVASYIAYVAWLLLTRT